MTALRECRQVLNVQDSWRVANLTDHTFSYASTSNTMSGIDWIYTRANLAQLLFEWTLGLLHNEALSMKIKEMGIDLDARMKNLPPDDRTSNPQTLWGEFKARMKEAMSAAKSQIAKISQITTALKTDLKHQLSTNDLDLNDALSTIPYSQKLSNQPIPPEHCLPQSGRGDCIEECQTWHSCWPRRDTLQGVEAPGQCVRNRQQE